MREATALLERFGLAVGNEMHDAAAPAVGVGAAEAFHVDLLASHGADDLGAGDEDAALGPEDDDVGEGGAVRCAACCGAQDDRDLRHLAGDARHGGEDATHGIETGNPLAQPCPAGVPDAHDGAGVGEGAVVGRDDRPATVAAHRPALDGGIRREGDDLCPIDRAHAHEHAAIILGSDGPEGSRVEERLEAYAR